MLYPSESYLKLTAALQVLVILVLAIFKLALESHNS